MKKLLLVLAYFFCFLSCRSQLVGKMYDYKTKKTIGFSSSDTLFFIIYSNSSSTFKVIVDSSGQFLIPKDLFTQSGSKVDISVYNFISSTSSLADIRLKNIPIGKLKLLLERFYLVPAYTLNASNDWRIIDNKRTYKQKKIIVNNGNISYILKRTPKRITKLNAIVYIGSLL